MDLAINAKMISRPEAPPALQPAPASPPSVDPNCDQTQGDKGTSSGINIAPGSNDDGWIVPKPVTLGDGSAVYLYKDGEALHAAYEAIKAAKHRILLEVYIFASDATGRAFAELLAAKAREGVSVYVLYDDFGSFQSDGKMFEMMNRAGVRLQRFHPLAPWECRFNWRPFNRDHRKLLLIDYDIAGLGGINVGGEYAGSWVVPNDKQECELWRDNAIGIRGPATKLFFHAFKRSWHYATHGGRINRAEMYHPIEGCDLGVLASVPTISSPLRPLLHKLLAGALKSIQLTMAYFAPDDPLIDALCRAARRGVKVQLMLPGRGDIPILVFAARSFYEKLMCAGVEVYERQSVILHAKTMVIDGTTTVIGSTNLDYRSIEYNLELSAIIRSEEFGSNMTVLFENDVRFARKISLSEWRKRHWRDKFVQWVVSRARYVL